MVAYSFQRRFVTPIRLGLSCDYVRGGVKPKRQTIRADRKRHARQGEKLQLYYGMRTKGCFLIGRAVCSGVDAIRIRIDDARIIVGSGIGLTLNRASELDDFARSDGFNNYEDFASFWREHHPDTMNDFNGIIIFWEAP